MSARIAAAIWTGCSAGWFVIWYYTRVDMHLLLSAMLFGVGVLCSWLAEADEE